MNEKSAYHLLFKKDFGNGSLFKNQGDLAFELIDDKDSYLFSSKESIDYAKKLGNLKVYVSQLFSQSTRRNVSQDFIKSLQIIISKKINADSFNVEAIVQDIVADLERINTTSNITTVREKDIDFDHVEFYSKISHANYLAIFSTREINFNKSTSVLDTLIDSLFSSLIEGSYDKWYRFNFPTHQTCLLFWVGLRKEIMKYLKKNKMIIDDIIMKLRSNGIVTLNPNNTNEAIESIISADVLKYLSANKVLLVFHQKSPVFLFPFIALNPNDRQTRSVYSFLQSDNGIDRIHKLTNDEVFNWGYFVWDNLRINESGVLVEYPFS